MHFCVLLALISQKVETYTQNTIQIKYYSQKGHKSQYQLGTYLPLSNQSADSSTKSQQLYQLVQASDIQLNNSIKLINCQTQFNVCETHFYQKQAPCIVRRDICEDFVYNNTNMSQSSLNTFLSPVTKPALIDTGSIESFMDITENSGDVFYMILLGKQQNKNIYNQLLNKYKESVKIGFLNADVTALLGVRRGILVKCNDCNIEQNAIKVNQLLNMSGQADSKNILITNQQNEENEYNIYNNQRLCNIKFDEETQKFIAISKYNFVTRYSSQLENNLANAGVYLSILYSNNNIQNSSYYSWYDRFAQQQYRKQSTIGRRMLFVHADSNHKWMHQVCEKYFHTQTDKLLLIIKNNQLTCIDFFLEVIEDFLEEALEENSFLRFTTHKLRL